MREIKFRIYADNKFYDKCLVGNTNNTNDDKWTCPMVWLEDRKEWVHCDNGIICQYTGMTDSKDVEIYESDIVKIIMSCKGDYMTAEVKYSDEYAQFVIVNTGSIIYESEPLGDILTDNIEVIGNIYDNQELLEKEGNTHE